MATDRAIGRIINSNMFTRIFMKNLGTEDSSKLKLRGTPPDPYY